MGIPDLRTLFHASLLVEGLGEKFKHQIQHFESRLNKVEVQEAEAPLVKPVLWLGY